ncbi:MAG: flagellin [Dehalococcoidia bacterium]
MAMMIATNVAAINAQRNLNGTSIKMGKVLEKLSSGYRINRAADDAAGLGISEKMRAQIRGNGQALRNSQDGISMIQTAEGAMDEIHSILQRARELSVQAANGTLDLNARQSVGTELVALQAEINRIAAVTQFNGQFLLNGSLTTSQSGGTVGVGTVVAAGTNTSVTAIDVSAAKASTTYTMTNAAGVLTLDDGLGNSQAITLAAIAASSSQVINFGTLGVKVTVSSVAGETAANVGLGLTGLTIITAAGSGSVAFQVGANVGNTMTVAMADVQATTATGLNLAFWAVSGVGSVDTLANANARLTEIDAAINTLNTRRSNLGAAQNRLEHTVASLGVAVENLSAAESRIRDADVAELSSKMVSNQILQQAGVSVLSQANQAPQAVLSLLRGQ